MLLVYSHLLFQTERENTLLLLLISPPHATLHLLLLPSSPFCQGTTLLLNYLLGSSVSTHSNKVFLQGLGWRRLI